MLKAPQTRDPFAGDGFAGAVVEWFVETGRHDLPWRQTADPYAILVSEIMLQQTQVATVLERGYFTRWLERFPDPAALAAAAEPEVLKCWEGLGYYNRARNLQKAARALIEEHGGSFPGELDKIRALPGVGRYTAGAIASIAFGRAAAVVDGNVVRVFARLFDFREAVDTPAAQKRFWEWAERLVPENRPREYNAGLMELGQRVCLRTSPACLACPVADWCAATDPAALPIKNGGPKTVFVTERVLFAVRDGRLLLERESGSRRRGLWKLPALPEDFAGEAPPVMLETKYSITHHRVDLIVQGWAGDPTGLSAGPNPVESEGELAWFDLQTEVPAIAMPSPYRRAVETILARQKA
ncbi:MAG: A/G-specific adenine glycosylase [Verrucomicrobiae bacterium]|nr:A/G-specific adenine glycosylase [Verrucomicrobiae bacterium]MCP5538993.1 A/G-specific adenine glycosylase [Akkermansiaceae bacterium]MCP5550620.1 A/G-specific adenine glycosylase [Akkermansiaceae bacterium]